MGQDCVLACDLGGTSLRVALIGGDGGELASCRLPLASGLEADPEVWRAGFLEAASVVADRAPDCFTRVQAIAISAFTRSQVFRGADGRSLRPAILWGDARAGESLSQLLDRCPPDHLERAALNAYHPLARLWWLKQAEPEVAASLASVLEPKDDLNLWLTGRVASDPISSARIRAAAAPGSDGRSLLEIAGFSASILPPTQAPASVMGRLRAGLPGVLTQLEGAAVMTMANDTWASVVGLGALRAGYAYNISGTTEVLGLVAAETAQVGNARVGNARAEGLLTVPWGQDLTQIGGPSQTGADALIWLRDLLGLQGEAIEPALAVLLEQPRDPEPVLFLPYLQGERVPYWDPDLRGAFLGLNRRHKAVDLAWAALEGVAFLNRVVLERAETAAGAEAVEIRFGGGGAASLAWRQVKADVLGRPVVTPIHPQQGLLGAAIVAWTGLGRFATLAAAQEALARPGARHEPNPARMKDYDRLYRLFRQAEAALVPISHALTSRG